jgi:catechol 1,2-dioxygenase
MSQATELDAKAADTGANATKVFQDKVRAGTASSTDRVAAIASDVLAGLHDVIRKHQVSYAEYDALKAWLIRLGQDGEWPLFLDVFVEHALETSVNQDRAGSKGTIEGPFYVPGAPELGADSTLPMRPDEPGSPLVFHGQVRTVGGDPLGGATVEIWHADSMGFYSQFAPGLPEWNLRGTVIADDRGRFSINTVLPAPYRIPGDGATGAFIQAAGWHTWRPAHLHLKVSAPGHQLVTSQLYFDGGEYLDSDIASAVKPELMLRPTATADGYDAEYDFELTTV